MFNALILCGGQYDVDFGIKLFKKSRCLLEINGKTLLERHLDKLVNLEPKSVVISTGHFSNEIIAFCNGKLQKHPLFDKLKIFVESSPLGTGGAVKYAYYKLKSIDPIVVMNGNIILTEELKLIAESIDPASHGAIMAVNCPTRIGIGSIGLDSKSNLVSIKQSFENGESSLINAGVYFLTSAALSMCPSKKEFSLEYDLLPRLLDFKCYQSKEAWATIRERDDWDKAKKLFR